MTATNVNRVKINHKPKLSYSEAQSRIRPEKSRKHLRHRGGSFDWNDYSR